MSRSGYWSGFAARARDGVTGLTGTVTESGRSPCTHPESVAQTLPPGVVAVPVSEPQAPLETSLVCRAGDPSPTLAAFVDIARGVFDTGSVLI